MADKIHKQRFETRPPVKPNRTLRLRAPSVKTINKKARAWQEAFDQLNPPFKQAKHMATAFGGIVPFSVLLDLHPFTVMKNWMGRPNPKTGYVMATSNGLLPVPVMIYLVVCARTFGVILKPHDIYPDLFNEHDEVSIDKGMKEIRQWLKCIKPKEKEWHRAFLDQVVVSVSTPE